LRAGPGALAIASPVQRLQVFCLTSRVVAGRVARVLAVTATALIAAPVSSAHGQRVLTVVASDSALDASPTVPAGITTIRLQLKGTVRRDLTVHRIPAGTAPEVLARGAAGRPERWFEQWSFGGPAVPRDSASDASATIDLRPGRYALVSYEVDAAGRPRGDRYVWRDVTAFAAAILIPARFAVPDATITVKDGRIEVIGALRTGQRTLQIENTGARPHDVLIARLKPGKTMDDVVRWDRDRNDPPPFVYVGGLTPMSTGVIAQTRLVLQSGVHVVFCTTRHARERERDYKRGVIATFKVN
jgi:hypothetical protein